MDKALILDRLEMLVSLCEETEPDVPTERHLFTEHSISVNTMIMEVRELTTGRKSVDPDSERDLIIKVMRESNKIWRLRNKVKNGDFDDLANLEMNETIEDFVAQGAKINAIKYYRQEMDENYGIRMSLRDAKEYIDNTAEDMRRRGIIK